MREANTERFPKEGMKIKRERPGFCSLTCARGDTNNNRMVRLFCGAESSRNLQLGHKLHRRSDRDGSRGGIGSSNGTLHCFVVDNIVAAIGTAGETK